jgi:hypothetical protein
MNQRVFDRIVRRLLFSANAEEREHLYLGRGYLGDYPLCLSGDYLDNHLVIRGASGRGKTTLLARLILQLLLGQAPERLAWLDRCGLPRPRRTSIVIGDLKGEPALFHEVRRLCKALGIPFKFFRDQVGYATHLFNPLSQAHLPLFTTAQCAQIILEAAGLTYGDGYGKSFFTSSNVRVLMKLLRAFRRRALTFRELHRILTDSIERAPADISGRDVEVGSHVEMFLGFMAAVHALNLTEEDLGGKPGAVGGEIDMTDLFREVQVVYFYLPHMLGSVEAPNILRLAMFMLITAAAEARAAGSRNRVVFFCDEAQKMISRNMSTIFEQARSHGTPLVLSHQYYGQLRESFEVDMTQNVDANCITAIDLGAPDTFAMKRIEELSPPCRYANLSWQQLAAGITNARDGRQFGPDKAAAPVDQEVFLRVSESKGPIFNRKTIQDISQNRRTGWFRVQDSRGYTRTPYVTPFVWDHHIARSKYEKYARAAWPAEDGETITVELDPFGLENSADEEE